MSALPPDRDLVLVQSLHRPGGLVFVDEGASLPVAANGPSFRETTRGRVFAGWNGWPDAEERFEQAFGREARYEWFGGRARTAADFSAVLKQVYLPAIKDALRTDLPLVPKSMGEHYARSFGVTRRRRWWRRLWDRLLHPMR